MHALLKGMKQTSHGSYKVITYLKFLIIQFQHATFIICVGISQILVHVYYIKYSFDYIHAHMLLSKQMPCIEKLTLSERYHQFCTEMG